MAKALKKMGAVIHEVVYCPHKPKEGCTCRKPNSKLIEDLAKKYDIILAESYMVGDTDTDIIAGKKLVRSVYFLGKGIR